jgi:Mg-chelatase subunit ChlD
VDRTGLDPGQYQTTFDVVSLQCGRQTIDVTMNVGRANVLFCVDTSGSMAENDPEDRRVDAVLETIDKFYTNTWVKFGIIDFDSDAEMLANFTRDMATLTAEANELSNDDGWTTYLGQGQYTPGALEVIDDMVDETNSQTQYVVIFVSDGEPTQGITEHAPIVAETAAQAGPDHVKLYTIYLNGDPEPGAEALLDDMAEAGGTGNVLVITDPDYLSFIDLKF